jgi:urease accessory protein UreF
MVGESGYEELATERAKLEEAEADDPVSIAEAEERFEVREERKERREQRDRRWFEALKRLTGRGQRGTQQ